MLSSTVDKKIKMILYKTKSKYKKNRHIISPVFVSGKNNYKIFKKKYKKKYLFSF
jgi:hypothetical protein